jgi:iron(III) transport system ATP-binding protein
LLGIFEQAFIFTGGSMQEQKGRDPYLRITDITKMFGDFVALDKISLEVYEGEFICFLGPSGCGKTTLLRAIAGLDIQTYGRVEQGGKDVSNLSASERDFGIVFQSYALFPNLTVYKNVAYGLENAKLPRHKIDARVAELLELVGMPEQSDKYPAQLSGGQQQRISLARALAISPGLLLLDEPLSALDAKVRLMLRHEIKSLQRRLGVTTVMVTHDQEEALTMADRIVVMNHGIIEQIGSPSEIYNEPATAFVADFIGTMNFLPGKVSGPTRIEIGDFGISCFSAPGEPGDQITVAIRPEDIVVQDDSDNRIDATIESIEFLGAFVRAELSHSEMGDVHFYADFSANQVRRTELKEGMVLGVGLPRENLRLYSA